MHILRLLKPVYMNGKTVQPGQIIKVADGQDSIGRGYARGLTKDEIDGILDGYVREALKVFSETIPEKKKIFGNREAMAQGKLL